MKTSIVVVVTMLTGLVAEASTNEIGDVSQEWELLKQEAVTNGMADASRDFSNGLYRIEIYGLRGTSKDPNDVYLEKKYQIKMNPVAGCCVTHKIVGHAEGYNVRMKELLFQKYGKDVFQEAENLWKQGKLTSSTKDALETMPAGSSTPP